MIGDRCITGARCRLLGATLESRFGGMFHCYKQLADAIDYRPPESSVGAVGAFLTDNAEGFGLVSVHDYFNSQVWRIEWLAFHPCDDKLNFPSFHIRMRDAMRPQLTDDGYAVVMARPWETAA